MIHQTAIIEPGAKIHDSVSIGPYSVIGSEVAIDEGTVIGPHVVINGLTKIGKFNRIYQFASVGEASQDKKYKGEATRLEIGDHNVIRECVTIHRGTIQDQSLTKIGNGNLFMANTHVAHDCIVGNNNTMANSSALAGHVQLADHVIISGMCGVHQFCKIGAYSFISMASMIVKDVPPYVMVAGGSSSTVYGLNVEGLRRHGFSAETIQWLRRAYKVIYRQGLRIEQALELLQQMEGACPEIKLFSDFLANSERGIVR